MELKGERKKEDVCVFIIETAADLCSLWLLATWDFEAWSKDEIFMLGVWRLKKKVLILIEAREWIRVLSRYAVIG